MTGSVFSMHTENNLVVRIDTGDAFKHGLFRNLPFHATAELDNAESDCFMLRWLTPGFSVFCFQCYHNSK